MTDNINHPQHYEGHTSLECIDVMEIAFGPEAVAYFCLCNSFKYLWRYKHKNGLEDLAKAEWYLERFTDISEVFSDSVHDKYFKMTKLLEKARKEFE